MIAGDTVECFCDVCCSFQDYFLEEKMVGKKKKNKSVTNATLTKLFSHTKMKHFPVQRQKLDAFLSKPVGCLIANAYKICCLHDKT